MESPTESVSCLSRFALGLKWTRPHGLWLPFLTWLRLEWTRPHSLCLPFPTLDSGLNGLAHTACVFPFLPESGLDRLACTSSPPTLASGLNGLGHPIYVLLLLPWTRAWMDSATQSMSCLSYLGFGLEWTRPHSAEWRRPPSSDHFPSSGDCPPAQIARPRSGESCIRPVRSDTACSPALQDRSRTSGSSAWRSPGTHEPVMVLTVMKMMMMVTMTTTTTTMMMIMLDVDLQIAKLFMLTTCSGCLLKEK